MNFNKPYFEPELNNIFQNNFGLDSELKYWEWLLSNKIFLRESLRFDSKFRKKIFPFFILNYFTNPFILEIGSGPLSDLAWGVESNLIELVAIDLLANEYKKLLKKYNLSYPVIPIMKDATQDLTKLGSFDIIYMRNSLDHSDNPQKVIQNCLNVLKKDGIIYITGNVDEGTRNNWTGLHKYNLRIIEGNLVQTTQNGKSTILLSKDNFKILKNIEENLPDKKWFTYVIRLNKDLNVLQRAFKLLV